MNTKGTKFLAVLAVLAMAFAGFAVIAEVQVSDAAVALGDDPVAAVPGQYSYAEGTHTLTIESFDAVKEAAVVFTGNDIKISGLTDDTKIAELGFVVKKTVGALVTYSSSVSQAFSTIANDKATAAAAKAAPVSVVLLADANEDNGIIMSGVDVTTKYVAVNFDLNGKTLTHTNAGGLVGVSSINKFIYANDNQILKITNGTIKSALAYANVETKDVAFALIQTYGPLTLGDGSSALTLDISGVTTAEPVGAPQNLAVGVLYASATSVINANVTIDAGKNVALYAVYGASNNVGWYQTANGGTDTQENSTTGVKVTVKNGATINGEVGAVYYTSGVDYGLNTITTGADLTIEGGSFTGKVVCGLPIYNAGNTVTPSISAAEGAVIDSVSIAGGTFSDVAALNYMTANSTAKVVAGDKEIPKPTTEPENIVTPDASGTEIPGSGTVIYNVGADITALPAAAITADVVFQAGAGDDVAFDTLTVKDTGSVSFVNMNSVTGVIKTTDGTNSQTLKLSAFQGTLTIAKGSIIINSEEWLGGDIELDNNAVVKISGSVDGDVGIAMKAGQTKGAKVIIEAGDANALTISAGAKLTIGEKIDVEINGKLIGENATSELDVQNAKSVTINSGAVVSAKITNTEKAVTVYSGSDINAANITAFDLIAGKDAASGTWSYDGGVLTLSNYNGTYNFGAIKAAVTNIILVGDNRLTFAPESGADAALFSNAALKIKTLQGTGSLIIDEDVSAVSKADMETGFTVITARELSSVDVTLNVTGINALWDATKITVKGDSGLANMDSSVFTVDVLSSLVGAKDKVYGIYTVADLIMNYSNIDATSAGTGLSVICDSFKVSNESSVHAEGKKLGASLRAFSITGKSSVTVAGGLELAGDNDLSQNSVFSAENLVLAPAATITNDADVTITGDSVIKGTINNKATMSIDGTVIINGAGKIDNKAGTLTNSATITVLSKTFENIAAATTITIGTGADDEGTVSAKTAFPYIITINAAASQDDGTVRITDAKVQFKGNTTDAAAACAAIGEATIVNYDKYTGTLTPTQTVAEAKGGYQMVLTNGTSTITIVKDSAITTPLAGYSITVTGTLTTTDVPAKTLGLTANTKTISPANDNVKEKIGNSTASILATGGVFNNNGAITSYGTAAQTIVGLDAVFNGDISVGVQAVTVLGKLDGKINAQGDVIVGAVGEEYGEVTGAITAKGDVTVHGTTAGITTDAGVASQGTIVGDILAKNNVAVKNMTGNITIAANGELTATFNGKMDGELIYVSKYKATNEATTTTEYTAKMKIKSDVDGAFVIILAAGQNAGPSTAVVPGFFKLGAQAEIGASKSADIALTEGTLKITDNYEVKKRYAITVESGTTLEVSNTATFDVSNAGLKVSSGATSNFVTGSTVVTTYGKVDCIMSFTVDGGAYTIYSDVAYALANCDENSELTVEADAPITANVKIPKGVTVYVSDAVTVAFGGFNLAMDDGAEIELLGTGKVTFTASGTTGTGAAMTYNSVSGNFVFGDNEVLLDKVMFNGDSSIAGTTVSEVTKLNLALVYDGGVATLTSGNATGAITLQNQHTAPAEKTSGTFIIDANTVYDGTIADAAQQAKKVDNVTTVTDLPSKVIVNGTFKVNADVTINGHYEGTGEIVLTASKKVTIKAAAGALAADPTAREAVVTAKIVDTTDAKNGYELKEVSGTELIITATKEGTADVVTINGSLDKGEISAFNKAYLNTFTVKKGATFAADSIYVIADSTATGVVKTKADLELKTGQKLIYDAKYMDGQYVVYTKIASIKDLSKVGEIEVDGSTFAVGEGDTLTGTFTIVVKTGTVLNIANNYIIGNAATTLGAGSTITGDLKIADGKYLIVYPDVTINGKILGSDDKAAAKTVFDIEGTVYATAYAKADNVAIGGDGKPSAVLIPKITGYTFTKWTGYDGTVNLAVKNIGDIDVTASLVAQKVIVKATFLDGVQYYCNGVLYDAVGIDNKVTVGSIFTAKIVDYSKYQGTPLVNGQNAFEVTEDVTLNVTGVSPVEPEPAPAPAGMSLTEILLIVLVVLIAIMVVIIALRLNRS